MKYFRNQQGITIRKLSETTGISTGYISDIENDSEGNLNPTKEKMIKLSEALGQTVPNVFFPAEDLNKKEVNAC